MLQYIDVMDNLQVGEPDEQDRSIDMVRVKHINQDNVTSVIFTKLQSSINQW